MPPINTMNLSNMNSYDAKHLLLLNLIQAQRWADIGNDEIWELRVLIACKYVTVTERVGQIPMIKLTPGGEYYHHRLSELGMRKGLESLMAGPTQPSYQVQV